MTRRGIVGSLVAFVAAHAAAFAQGVTPLHCTPPAQDLGRPLPAVGTAIRAQNMPSGQSQQVCQTFTVAQFPLDKLAEVHCFSFSREAYDLEARSGYRCVDPTCPDGASISGITLENVTTNGTPGVKACATLTNSSPRRKTLAVDFTFRH